MGSTLLWFASVKGGELEIGDWQSTARYLHAHSLETEETPGWGGAPGRGGTRQQNITRENELDHANKGTGRQLESLQTKIIEQVYATARVAACFTWKSGLIKFTELLIRFVLQAILRRISSKEPYYNHFAWDEDWSQNNEYMSNISNYPRKFNPIRGKRNSISKHQQKTMWSYALFITTNTIINELSVYSYW